MPQQTLTSESETEAENDSQSWFTRAYAGLYSESDVYQREFAQAFLDEWVRPQVVTQQTPINVQRGLAYDPDLQELVDGFVVGINDVTMQLVAGGGYEQIHLSIVAETIDTAIITNTNELGDVETQPGIETRHNVRCDLGVSAVISTLVDADISCHVYIPEDR